MSTLREQLRDPIFRKWMTKVPTLRVIGMRPPWWVYLQREVDGPWARAAFDTYQTSYRFLTANLRDVADCALNCSRQEFQPPIVRVKAARRYYLPRLQLAEAVHWCGHCRRLVEFKYFSKHHALKGIRVDSTVKRCVICGVRQNTLKRYP